MQMDAMNFNADAGKDCGCCEYERVVFFSRSAGYYVSGLPYSINTYPIKIFVGDQEVGTITAFYPNGPGNPNVPGVVVYKPQTNKKKIEWFAKVTSPNGSFIILGSGTFDAGSNVRYVAIL